MGYKGFPFGKTAYYRRLKRARSLGCGVMDVPDGRGKHGKHNTGRDHARWNDGRILSSQGYVLVRVGKSHPLAHANGYAYEHTLVWVAAGDTLAEDEMLHHINGDKTDNRWQNLQRMNRSEHINLHINQSEHDNGPQ